MSTSPASSSPHTPSPAAATPSGAELATEAASWAVGGGILTMALFPFALPLILLTVAALIPLLLVGLVVGIVAALAAAPVLLARRLLRARRYGGSPAASRAPSGSAKAWTRTIRPSRTVRSDDRVSSTSSP